MRAENSIMLIIVAQIDSALNPYLIRDLLIMMVQAINAIIAKTPSAMPIKLFR